MTIAFIVADPNIWCSRIVEALYHELLFELDLGRQVVAEESELERESPIQAIGPERPAGDQRAERSRDAP